MQTQQNNNSQSDNDSKHVVVLPRGTDIEPKVKNLDVEMINFKVNSRVPEGKLNHTVKRSRTYKDAVIGPQHASSAGHVEQKDLKHATAVSKPNASSQNVDEKYNMHWKRYLHPIDNRYYYQSMEDDSIIYQEPDMYYDMLDPRVFNDFKNNVTLQSIPITRKVITNFSKPSTIPVVVEKKEQSQENKTTEVSPVGDNKPKLPPNHLVEIEMEELSHNNQFQPLSKDVPKVLAVTPVFKGKPLTVSESTMFRDSRFKSDLRHEIRAQKVTKANRFKKQLPKQDNLHKIFPAVHDKNAKFMVGRKNKNAEVSRWNKEPVLQYQSKYSKHKRCIPDSEGPPSASHSESEEEDPESKVLSFGTNSTEAELKVLRQHYPQHRYDPMITSFKNSGPMLHYSDILAPGLMVNCPFALQNYFISRGWQLCYDNTNGLRSIPIHSPKQGVCNCLQGIRCTTFVLANIPNIVVWNNAICQNYDGFYNPLDNTSRAIFYSFGQNINSLLAGTSDHTIVAAVDLVETVQSLSDNILSKFSLDVRCDDVSFRCMLTKYSNMERHKVFEHEGYYVYALNPRVLQIEVSLGDVISPQETKNTTRNTTPSDPIFANYTKLSFYQPAYLGYAMHFAGVSGILCHHSLRGKETFELLYYNSQQLQKTLRTAKLMKTGPKMITAIMHQYNSTENLYGIPSEYSQRVSNALIYLTSHLVQEDIPYMMAMSDTPYNYVLRDSLIDGIKGIWPFILALWYAFVSPSVNSYYNLTRITTAISELIKFMLYSNDRPSMKIIDNQATTGALSKKWWYLFVGPIYEEALKVSLSSLIYWLFVGRFGIHMYNEIAMSITILYATWEITQKSRTRHRGNISIDILAAFPFAFHLTLLWIGDGEMWMSYVVRTIIHLCFNWIVYVLVYKQYERHNAQYGTYVATRLFSSMPMYRKSCILVDTTNVRLDQTAKLVVSKPISFAKEQQEPLRKILQTQVSNTLSAPPAAAANTYLAAYNCLSRQLVPVDSDMYYVNLHRKFVGGELADYMRPLGWLEPLSDEEYIDRIDEPQKTQYKEAVKYREMYGTSNRLYTSAILPKVENTKVAYTDVMTGCETMSKAVRCVTSVTKHTLARQLWFITLTDAVKKMFSPNTPFDHRKPICYATSCLTTDIGRWMMEHYPGGECIIEADCSSFDGHQAAPVRRNLARLYRKHGLIGHDYELYVSSIDKWVAKNHYKTDNGTFTIRASREGSQSSGHPSTSVDNTLCSISYALLALCTWYGESIRRVLDFAAILVLGDDICVVDKRNKMPVSHYTQILVGLGHEPKVFRRTIYNATFCSQFFVVDNELDEHGLPKHCMLGPIARRFNRAAWHVCGEVTDEQELLDRAYTDTITNMYAYSTVPIVGEYLDYKYKLLRSKKAKFDSKYLDKSAKYKLNPNTAISLSDEGKEYVKFRYGVYDTNISYDNLGLYGDLTEITQWRQFCEKDEYPTSYMYRAQRDSQDIEVLFASVGNTKRPNRRLVVVVGLIILLLVLAHAIDSFVMIPQKNMKKAKRRTTRAKAVEVVAVAPKVNRTVRPKQRQTGKTSVPLFVNNRVKHNFKVTGTHDGVHVGGTDIIQIVAGAPIIVGFQTAERQQQSRSYFANPGVSSVFPKLSQIARAYDRALLHEMTLEYVPIVAMTEPGQIGLFIQEDPSDPAPSDMVNLMQYKNSDSGSATQPHRVRYKASKKEDVPIFTEAEITGISIASPFYSSMIQFGIIAQGLLPNTNYGYLVIHYKFTLMAMRSPTPTRCRLEYVNGDPSIPGNGQSLNDGGSGAVYQRLRPVYTDGQFNNQADITLGQLWNGVWNNSLVPWLASSLTVPAGKWTMSGRVNAMASSQSRLATSEVVIVEQYVNPNYEVKSPYESKEDLIVITGPRRPMAAGDVAVNVYGTSLGSIASVENLFSFVINGAGAITFPFEQLINITKPMRLALNVYSPDAGRKASQITFETARVPSNDGAQS